MPNAFTRFGNRLLDPGNLTDENVRQNQQMADVLLNQVSQPQPIRSPWQGVAQLANALNAQIYRQRGERGEKALQEQKAKQLGDFMSSLSLNPQQSDMLKNAPQGIQQQLAAGVAQNQLAPPQTPDVSTKQFREGGEYVTRRIVNGQPDMTDQGVLSRSPIDRIQRVEQGAPGSFDPRTRSQQGKDVQDFQNAVIGGIGAIQQGSLLLNLSDQSPEAIGAPGAIARVGNEFLQTGKSLGTLLGIETNAERDVDQFTFDGFSGNLREAAINNQEFRSGIYGIAFAAAVAEQGSRPTDKDIQAYIDQIAGSTADPKAFQKTIQSFIGRIDRRLRNTAQVKDIPNEIRQRAFSPLDQSLDQFNSFFGPDLKNIKPEDIGKLTDEQLQAIINGQQ